jgi:hypothetical protein
MHELDNTDLGPNTDTLDAHDAPANDDNLTLAGIAPTDLGDFGVGDHQDAHADDSGYGTASHAESEAGAAPDHHVGAAAHGEVGSSPGEPRFGSGVCPHCNGTRIWYGELCTWCKGTGLY